MIDIKQIREAFAELLNANEPKNDEIEKSVKALVDKLDSVYYCSNCGCCCYGYGNYSLYFDGINCYWYFGSQDVMVHYSYC